jgi:four helix bundle protein
MEKSKSFKNLKIWQKGIEIVKDIYSLTNKFPNKELYGLTSQMRRSSISIPSNIAEGFKRSYKKEFKQFLHITLGSLAELETQLIIAKELGYIKDSELNYIAEKIDHEAKMVTSYANKLV